MQRGLVSLGGYWPSKKVSKVTSGCNKPLVSPSPYYISCNITGKFLSLRFEEQALNAQPPYLRGHARFVVVAQE